MDIEREGPGIIERLPEALFKAVKRNAVPDDLERDVTALAEWLQPQVRPGLCCSLCTWLETLAARPGRGHNCSARAV